ncbi:hypothetical protein VPH35_016801 [Triticum aestivum]
MEGSEDGARRRRPQTHASDEAVGVTRLHPQVHASQEGSGVARPPRQIHATGDGAGAIRRGGIFPASPIEDEDLLREILLRLPPQPSSLVRASAVCKQWRCAATDPKFLRRFRLHHRKPPLLGLFHRRKDDIVFTPIMDRPDRIPPRRFHLHLRDIDSHNMGTVELLDCRHDRVLLTDKRRDEVIVRFIGAVLCATIDQAHVHESCHSSPFKVVLISYLGGDNRLIVRVYSSETGVWDDIISTTGSYYLFDYGIPGLLVGNALYWLLDITSAGILKFDLDEQSLAMIRWPPVTNDFRFGSHCMLRMARSINCHGVVTWVLRKTIDTRTIIGLPKQFKGKRVVVRRILGFLEDSDGILLSVGCGAHMVQLKSMKSSKLCKNGYYTHYLSFRSFYPPGTSIADGFDGAEMMHDTQGVCLI